MKYFNKVEIVKIALTHECNLACPYCSDNLSKYKKEDFSCEDITIQWLKTLPRLRIITMYGGEPLLSSKCLNYIQQILKEIPFPVRVCIFTNGTIINDNILELLQNPRVIMNLTYSSNKESQNERIFKNNGESSYNIVNQNVKSFYEVCGNRISIIDTITQSNLCYLSDSIINDFKTSDSVEMNIIRSQTELKEFGIIKQELNKIVKYLLDNPNKCLKNFSRRPPLDLEFKRDYYLFIQGTYTDYVNGIKNILVDVDGKIYPGTSIAGKGFYMGSIYGEINDKYYEMFFESKEDCDCEYKYMCVPNYENYNPNNVYLPFKHPSHCNYFKTVYNAMSEYYKELKERGYV